MKTLRSAIGLSALVLLTASAQEFRALISGKIADPTGAAIADADVAVVNRSTGVRSATKSASDGNFVLPQLPPGTYELTAEAKGFRKYIRQGIALAMGDKASLEIGLELGDLASSVTVTAELTGIESNQSITGQLMDNKNISELPLNGRQVFMLVQLSAGVVFTQQFFGPGGFSGTRAYDMNGLLSIHGGRANTNAFLLDGAPLGVDGQWDYAPLVDGIEEFKVATPINDASQGLTGGGVVNMTMKSGGNQMHGLLSHFIRNHMFDARRTQENRIAATRPDLAAKQHQWNDVSFLVSGPIIKNKFFYLGSYEVFWDRVPRATTQTVPTLLQRAGDFSQTFNASNQLMVVFDPLTTRQSGSAFVRDAFPGNRIPSNRAAVVSQNILKYVPEPNMVTNPITNFNNFGSSPNVSKFLYNSWYMKFDYLWNEAHRTFFSETQNYGSNYANNNGVPFGNPARTGSDPRRRNHYAATLDHVYTINSTTVLNTRVAWDRFVSHLRAESIEALDASSLGFKGRTGSFPLPRFPASRFTDYMEIANTGGEFNPNDVFSAVADVSRTVNRHFLKFGARIGQARLNRNITGEWYGRFTFDKGWTQRDPQRGDTTSGNDIASFLLGFPASGGTDVNPQSSIENKFVGFYVQDDIKVAPKLTLNLGLRWDLQTAPTERFNRLIYAFDPTATYSLGNGQAKGGFLFGDDKRRQPWDTNWKDFQPRFGVAYQAMKKTVWRGGYGLSFLPLNGTGGSGGIDQTGYARRTPFVATAGGGLNSYIPGLPGAGIFENPFPNGILPPFGSGLGVKTQLGQGVSFQNRGYEVPRVHQFNFGFEVELPWKARLEAAFVGSRTRKFPVSRSLSAVSLEDRLKGFADPNYLNSAVPNPFAGATELVGTSLAAASITRAQSLSQFPQFASVTRNGNSLGNTSYNALEMRVNKRMSSGVSITGSYTFSKTLEAIAYREPQYDAVERVIASFDRTHHLSVSALMQIPFGRGKRVGTNWSKALDAIAGNWQYNFIVEHMNGTPTPMPDAIPLRDPRMPEGQRTFNRWFNTCTLLASGARSGCASPDEPVSWQQLRPNQLRTYSSYFPNLRNHWQPQVNMSIFKVFPIKERVTFELRGEAFNAFNTPMYQGPNVSLTSAAFGVVVLDQQNFPRNMQFAWRIRF